MINNTPPVFDNQHTFTETVYLVKLAECLDRELVRIPSDQEKTSIVQFLLQNYYSNDLHSFFATASLANITKLTMSNLVIRDYVLNVTQHWSLSLLDNAFDIVIINERIARVTAGLNLNPNKTHSSLLPKDLLESLYVFSEEELINLLTDNPWLSTLYAAMLAFPYTSIYKGVNSNG